MTVTNLRRVVDDQSRYDPVYAGPVQHAAAQEGPVSIIFAVSQAMSSYLFRITSTRGALRIRTERTPT
jgi:hypothetical protein